MLLVKNPNGDLVYWDNKTSDWGAEHTRDDTGRINSYSYETFSISLNDMDCYANGRYEFYIVHYAGPDITSSISIEQNGGSSGRQSFTTTANQQELVPTGIAYTADRSKCSTNGANITNQDFSLVYAKAAQAVYNKDIQYIEDNGIVWKKIRDKSESYFVISTDSPLTGHGSTIPDPTIVSSIRSIDIGFHASVYTNGTECIMAFEGTNPTSFSDWFANISHVTSSTIPDQYTMAKNYLQSIIDSSSICNSNITVVGHSLGGGLATFSGLSLGVNAFVFNPAGLWSSTIDNIGIRGNSSVTNYIARGYSNLLERELSDLVSSTGILFGDKVNVSVNIDGGLLPYLTLHSMDSMLVVLSNSAYAERYVEQ